MTRAAGRIAAGALAVGTVLAMSAAPASAHTALTGSTPKKDSSVAAPSEIVLTYTETIRLPRVLVTDASGKQYQAGTAKAVDNKVTQPVNGALPNGKYTVGWRVVSVDGHPVSGSYKFTVEGSSASTGGASGSTASPGAGSPQPVIPAASPSNAAASEESGGGSSGWLWIGLIALVIAGAGGAVAWFRRSPASGG
ncbi:copper resistance protein CopC [Actinomadura sp. KC216]|uniref:copper resistance CopC family protein n=1 Tax=Actinomadura sp. KC216 TaxID=2530370 RepID=UPI00104AF669|nr:copper resistance protein CopC [Actinomadura sp. KC216]TDB85567.1 copper resistance protein CopC [Actinomadura sp. KC216]